MLIVVYYLIFRLDVPNATFKEKLIYSYVVSFFCIISGNIIPDKVILYLYVYVLF